MEPILDSLQLVPAWLWWVTGIIAVFAVFGDRCFWEYEAKFPLQAGVGRGEFEIKHLKRRGIQAHIRLQLDEHQSVSSLEVLVNGNPLISETFDKPKTRRLLIQRKLAKASVDAGDLATVQINGQEALSAPLVLD